jgi:hypothetical protein
MVLKNMKMMNKKVVDHRNLNLVNIKTPMKRKKVTFLPINIKSLSLNLVPQL